MQSVVLLAAENEKLRIANERQKRKRQLKRRYISKQSALSAAEGIRLVLDPKGSTEVENGHIIEEAESDQILPILVDAPAITCYICRGYDHLAVDCQKYK